MNTATPEESKMDTVGIDETTHQCYQQIAKALTRKGKRNFESVSAAETKQKLKKMSYIIEQEVVRALKEAVAAQAEAEEAAKQAELAEDKADRLESLAKAVFKAL